MDQPHTPEAPEAPGTPERLRQLSANYNRVVSRLRAAETAAGRSPGEVELVPVTKFHHPEDVRMLLGLGATVVGENRVEEAATKHDLVPEIGIDIIGRIQTKKAHAAARVAHRVHSVDSEKIARALNRGVGLAIERGQRPADHPLQVLIQYSCDGDPHRGGVTADRLTDLAGVIDGELDSLVLAGVMCMPPLAAEPGTVIATARRLTDRLAATVGRRLILSAGMSGDMEQAVAAGSDLVRVGTAIMGTRPLN
ncbi:YggS family pyridoxal phosphate-dependent enzyme [Corynebacterium mendelii]|uniref:Pyridoxal phosphate homeostasis protein n=1 Tax=Corynebacterium mendelii TaxID=2765362 RepID=A0A939E056_9CORY|nr:YggS family pyridoxal phosphate-dependent enzyme [Corynebacterium mendelii]MBN9643107.1 YggS family pyridoxal phosphate-dependent enzyme [Corynebacterium mendelii]